MKSVFNNIVLLIILFLGNIFINDKNYFFQLIYICIALYHLYICFIIKNKGIDNYDFVKFIVISLLLYIFTYFIICDPNPFFCLLTFYTFFPNFIKSIFIVVIHTYVLSIYINNNKSQFINVQTIEESSLKFTFKKHNNSNSYFLSFFINYLLKKKYNKYIWFGLITFLIIDIITFLNRIKIWVHFYKKEKTLPNATSRNTTYYVTSNVVNIENIIGNYVEELKKLMNYLGERNIIISLVENGDSIDNTRKILRDFQNYLNQKKILNKFYLERMIEDPRKVRKPFEKYSRLRIEYFAKLRNKCLEFLHEIPDLDFNNTIIIFLNDIVFKYEDIINLLSTNKEDFDVVCGLDMNSNTFYDRWVSIDLEGDGMRKYFPFFVNKEAQDLVVNHKPIRVFSCWNGIIALKASPFKDKQIQFRYKLNYTQPNYSLNNPAKDYYESECTFLNIDLFSLGYTKKFINPDVRVTYKHQYFFESKYFVPSFGHILGYLIVYFVGLTKQRNKSMSDYKSDKVKLGPILYKWYLENRK